MGRINNGVSCNVCDCVYNEDGCKCNKDKIEVSMGSSNVEASTMEGGKSKHHFCKSYISKN